MADALAFDTLTTLDQLRTAGFSDAQARALTTGLKNVASARQGDLVTKVDMAALRTEIADVRTEIADVRTELRTEIAAVRTGLAELKAEFKADLAGLETRLLKAMNDQQRWTIGFTGVMLTLLFAAIKLL